MKTKYNKNQHLEKGSHREVGIESNSRRQRDFDQIFNAASFKTVSRHLFFPCVRLCIILYKKLLRLTQRYSTKIK